MIPKIHTNESPVLFDKVIAQMCDSFTTNLQWLNNAFGRVYHIEKDDKIEPHIFVGNGEYFSLLPSDEIGNFSFFDVEDPQNINVTGNGNFIIELKAAIIFWFSITSIYNETDLILTEDVKLEILNAILKPGILTDGRVEVTAVKENIKNVYKGFSTDHIDAPFLVHPYYAFRFECTIKIRNTCSLT